MVPVPAFRLVAVTLVSALRYWLLLLAEVLVVRFVEDSCRGLLLLPRAPALVSAREVALPMSAMPVVLVLCSTMPPVPAVRRDGAAVAVEGGAAAGAVVEDDLAGAGGGLHHDGGCAGGGGRRGGLRR